MFQSWLTNLWLQHHLGGLARRATASFLFILVGVERILKVESELLSAFSLVSKERILMRLGLKLSTLSAYSCEEALEKKYLFYQI